MKTLSIALIVLLFLFPVVHKSDTIIYEEELYVPLTEEILLKRELNIENLIHAIEFYGLEHKEVVLAQAILETGWFTSSLCLESNNLFGLYDSKEMDFFKFDHWIYSVRGYKRSIQHRLKETDEDYYYFLKRIGYAEDPQYIPKLQTIIKKHLDYVVD